MTVFTLHLHSAMRAERFEAVTSFVGEDASGQFGIQARHSRVATVLSYGLARFRTTDDTWHYLALPGAVLYFARNTLHLSTRRYVLGTDLQKVGAALESDLLAEEQRLATVKASLLELERALFQRLWKMEPS